VGEGRTARVQRDEGRRERQLVRVHLEERVDAVLGLARRVPVGLLSEVVLVVLCASEMREGGREESGSAGEDEAVVEHEERER